VKNVRESGGSSERRVLGWVAVCVAVGMIVVLLGIAVYYAGEIAFDFRLSNSGSHSNVGGIMVRQGSSGTLLVTVSLVKGLAHAVTLSCSGASGPLPAGVSCSFVPESGFPSFNATLTVTTSPEVPRGYYTIEAIGTAGGIARVTLFTLIVT
jgi:hypothetical protein